MEFNIDGSGIKLRKYYSKTSFIFLTKLIRTCLVFYITCIKAPTPQYSILNIVS
jgi:hypothetical protein